MKAIRPADRRIVAALLAAFAVPCAILGPSAARAETSVVVDVATGAVLSQKDATLRWYPASTTKLMTAYVALKALKEGRAGLDSPVVVTRYAASQAPSKMGFEPGSVMRLDNALRMMLVKSANDIAVAIGQAIGNGAIGNGATENGSTGTGAIGDGTIENGALADFVAAMNRDALALGMKDTHFINPNGLPGEGQYSSAKDLAILASAIRREFPELSDFFGTEAISTGTAIVKNTNALLGRFEGADGMKTGYICASGFNLVGSATRNGRTLVAVVLGADGSAARDRRVAELLEQGFKATPGSGSMKLVDLPATSGPPADISERICSPAGRTARANEAKAEEKARASAKAPPEPDFLPDVKRPPSVVEVRLGGAAGNGKVAPGITLIAAYGIPVPTLRPVLPEDASNAAAAELRGTEGQTLASSDVDLGVTHRGGIPIPTPRVAN